MMHFVKYLSRFARVDTNRLVHSLKTAIAFLLGMLIVRVLHLQLQGQWVLISILVVMCAQSRVGAILHKSYMRFLGTVIGASFAGLTLWLVYPDVILTVLMLSLATALFSYLSDSQGALSEAGTLGAMTTIIIVIGQNPTLITAVFRFLEINLGIVIALLVSRFIWPLHSRTQLRYILTDTLSNLKKLSEQLEELTSEDEKAKNLYEIYEDKVVSRLVTQSKLFSEVMRESFGKSDLAQVFTDILRSEREVLRCLDFMRDALMRFSGQRIGLFNQQPQIKKIYEVSQTLFQNMIDTLKNKAENLVLDPILDSQETIREMLQSLDPQVFDQFTVDLFIFSANRLLVRLYSMLTLIKKV